MSISLFNKEYQPNKITNTKNDNLTEQNNKDSLYRNARYGASFGAGIGLGDGFLSSVLIKRDIRNTMNGYRSFTFEQKRKAVSGLHNQNMTVRRYKEFANKILNMSIPKTMLKRALLYGGITAAVGMVIDVCKNKKSDKNKTLF